MKTVFEKLKLTDQKEILVLNEPEGFDKNLEDLKNIEIYESLLQVTKVDFAIVFVTTINDVEDQMQTLLLKLKDDAILWLAYPTNSLKTDIDEKYNWKPLTSNCFETTKSVLINDDWQAIRFRKLEYLKSKKNCK
jgi:hypothetical protein